MNWSGLEESDSSAFGPAGPVNFGGGNFASSRTEDVTKSIEWFSTARLRAGVTGGRFLLFGTAGVAFAEIESDTRVQFGNDATFLNDSEFVGSGTETQIGIAVGGGLEYAMGRWSVEGEYLFVDFGDFDYDSPCVNASALCTGVPGASWNTTVKAQENIGRIGLSYRWGGGE